MNVAIVYDGSIRDVGTPLYVRAALAQTLGEQPEWYTEASVIPHSHDYYIHVDDGRDDLPVEHIPHPWGYWAIDSHLGPEIRRHKASLADIVWCAQKPFADQLRAEGLNAHWLPLACEPLCHSLQAPYSPTRDLVFVGHLQPPPSKRIPFLSHLFKAFPNSWIEWGIFHQDMAAVYGTGRIGVNHAVKDDLNMRFFELASIGVPQLAPSYMQGLLNLGFKAWEHYIPYDSPESAIHRAGLVLNGLPHDPTPAQDLVRSKHTYTHRVAQMLEQASRLTH